ncbi:hypothetical protein [Nocardia vinacea]|uniref:hypothetical protein n=1 Tax=Nocardia vinacea TaxID=96468 RepID=UPI0012F6BA25|nr:hypothetical protein [Nocardia vinacea]
MPAHVTALIRLARPVPFAAKFQPALTVAPPASEEARSAAKALFASKARTQEPRNRPLRRRSRPEPLLDGGPKVGPEPQRAFTGDLGRVLGRLQANRGE